MSGRTLRDDRVTVAVKVALAAWTQTSDSASVVDISRLSSSSTSSRTAIVAGVLVVTGALILAIVVRAVGDSSDRAAPATTEAAAPSTSVTDTSPESAPVAPSSSPAGASAAMFREDFETAAGLDRFDYQLHTSSNGDTNTLISASFMGEHDEGCHGPDTHRVVQGGDGSPTFVDVSDSDLIWWCAPSGDPSSGHFMTALDTTDIATLSFSPRERFTDVTRVCWDQNMNNLGEGKWLNVFVVPASDVAAHGGNLNYAAATGLSFGGNDLMVPPGGFNFTWLRGSTMAFTGYEQTMDFWKSVEPGGMDPSPAPRYRICLHSGGDMVIDRPDGTTDRMALGATFPTGDVKVIFQDGSYNPTKHNGSADHVTWHWDNIEVDAA